MSYLDDSFLKAQLRMLAFQKKLLAKKQKMEAPEATPEKQTEDISVFEYLDRLENDINLTRNDLDEYMNYKGTAARNMPSMHQIGPLSRKILAKLKKVNFRDVPEGDLRELLASARQVGAAQAVLSRSVDALNTKGVGGTPRQKDEPFRRMFKLVNEDLLSLLNFVGNALSNVGGHDYLTGVKKGAGIPKRFL